MYITFTSVVNVQQERATEREKEKTTVFSGRSQQDDGLAPNATRFRLLVSFFACFALLTMSFVAAASCNQIELDNFMPAMQRPRPGTSNF